MASQPHNCTFLLSWHILRISKSAMEAKFSVFSPRTRHVVRVNERIHPRSREVESQSRNPAVNVPPNATLSSQHNGTQQFQSRGDLCSSSSTRSRRGYGCSSLPCSFFSQSCNTSNHCRLRTFWLSSRTQLWLCLRQWTNSRRLKPDWHNWQRFIDEMDEYSAASCRDWILAGMEDARAQFNDEKRTKAMWTNRSVFESLDSSTGNLDIPYVVVKSIRRTWIFARLFQQDCCHLFCKKSWSSCVEKIAVKCFHWHYFEVPLYFEFNTLSIK